MKQGIYLEKIILQMWEIMHQTMDLQWLLIAQDLQKYTWFVIKGQNTAIGMI